MTVSFVPLDNKKHLSKFVKTDKVFTHAQGKHLMPIFAIEFIQASNQFPIIFVKESETGSFKSAVMMGFEQDENLIFDGDKVNTHYVPANIRRHPFALGGEAASDENLLMLVDESALTDNADEGFPLFNDSGENTAELAAASKFMSDLIVKEQATRVFCDYLAQQDLLQAAELTINMPKGDKQKLHGLYKINEEKLTQLSDEAALDMYKRGYFPAVYAHLASLGQLNRLIALKASK